LSELEFSLASRFADLALACVEREFPTKISHALNSEADLLPPRKLTPAFYGCYDWHSAVHGHWLLARLARIFPDAPFTPPARQVLQRHLTSANIAAETAYLHEEGRASFERPYGQTWLLQLGAELSEWQDEDTAAQQLRTDLEPLENTIVARLSQWLVKLPFPVRSGEHSQTAFAMGLMLDYAHQAKKLAFLHLLASKARKFYAEDEHYPLHYEPSGEDFLSPSLAEADLMRRVMPQDEFGAWLARFLPQIPRTQSSLKKPGPGSPSGKYSGDLNDKSEWLRPVPSPDPGDPKLAHLDGLNLSRAWMLEGIAAGLPANDPRTPAIAAAALAHSRAGLAAVTGEHYESAHWLGSFAVYLLTRRGLPVLINNKKR